MKRQESRGYSILAALVFVGLLSGVTFAVQTLSPAASISSVNPASQRAEAGGSTGAQPMTKEQACDDAKEEAIRGKSLRTTDDDKNLKDNCVGAVYVPPKVPPKTGDPKQDKKNYKCVGRQAVVSINGDDEKIRSLPKDGVPEGLCKTLACGTPGADGKRTCIEADRTSLSKGVTDRAPSNPADVNDVPEKEFTMSKEDFDKAFENDMGIDKNSQDALNKAFQQEQLSEQIKENEATKNGIEQLIQGCAYGNTDPGCTSENIQKMEDQKKALDAENNKLREQMRALEEGDKAQITDKTPTGSCERGGTCTGDERRYPAPDCSGDTCVAKPKTKQERDALINSGYKCVGATCTRDKFSSTFPPTPPGGPSGGPGGGPSGGPGGGGGGNPMSALGSLMQGLMKGLGQQKGPPCPSDPAAFQQQQQQYQMQMQQYNMQLQQYNYQSQIARYNGYPPPIEPTPPVACTPGSNTNTCPTPPQQPPAANCPNGTWRPQTTQQTNGRQCTTGWQCAPGSTTPPEAELSCQPEIVDVGMTVAIAYSCSNSTTSSGSGFTTGGALSGATSTVIANPPANARNAKFVLTCRDQNLTARAECKVQIAKPKISITARPNPVMPGATTTVAWITSGMESCVVSSTQLPAFTAENADKPRINGTAPTPPITGDTEVLLTCETLGGNTKTATTTIRTASSTASTVIVSSTLDGDGAVKRGATSTISWDVTDAPANSAVALWVVDVATGNSIGLIRGQLATAGNYSWIVPSAPSACPVDTPIICGADMIAGREYAISATLYTPPNAHLGGYPPPNPTQPTYLGQDKTRPFRLSN